MPAPANSILPPDATWVGVLLLVIFGLFLAAAAIGIVGRMVAPEAYDDTVRTDEPDAD